MIKHARDQLPRACVNPGRFALRAVRRHRAPCVHQNRWRCARSHCATWATASGWPTSTTEAALPQAVGPSWARFVPLETARPSRLVMMRIASLSPHVPFRTLLGLRGRRFLSAWDICSGDQAGQDGPRPNRPLDTSHPHMTCCAQSRHQALARSTPVCFAADDLHGASLPNRARSLPSPRLRGRVGMARSLRNAVRLAPRLSPL